MNNPPSHLGLLLRDRCIKFLCLNALLIGSASLAMDVNPIDQGKALCDAAAAGNLNVVKTLLAEGVPVDAKDYRGWTPLVAATDWGRLEVCRLLLEHKAEVDAKDNIGGTCLMYAAHWGEPEICQLLLECNAQVNAKDKNGCTALEYYAAMNAHNSKTLNLLINAMIKQMDKAAAITLLGMSRFKRAPCMNGIDRNVIRLIAGYVVDADTKNLFAQIGTTKYKDLFAQIDSIEDASMRDSIRTYVLQKLKMDQKTNNGESHE